MSIIKKGSTAIVTGGGSGIGFEFVKVLVEEGVLVLVADIALTEDCEKFLQGAVNKAIWVKTDVTSWPDLEKAFDTAKEVFGGIDLVCPCAGILDSPSSSFWYPPGSEEAKDDVRNSRYKTLDIDLVHPIRVAQMAIEYFMKEKQTGHVLLVSSISAQFVTPTKPLYCASKAGISTFTRCMAPLATPPEGIPKVIVNAIAPGMVKTGLWQNVGMDSMLDAPLGWMTTDEVGRAMLKMVMTDEYTGGQVVEATKGQMRVVQAVNDPGHPKPEAFGWMSAAEIKAALSPMVAPIFSALVRMMK